jgi:hypothetical protein
MKESITMLRKWNLIAGGNDPKNDVIPASVGYGLEEGLQFAVSEISRLEIKLAEMERLASVRLSYIKLIEAQNDAASERIKRLEAVTNDPHALWVNWLRGDVKLPSDIGDVRQYQARINHLETALREIANQDYRGNRSTESQIAAEALKEAKL